MIDGALSNGRHPWANACARTHHHLSTTFRIHSPSGRTLACAHALPILPYCSQLACTTSSGGSSPPSPAAPARLLPSIIAPWHTVRVNQTASCIVLSEPNSVTSIPLAGCTKRPSTITSRPFHTRCAPRRAAPRPSFRPARPRSSTPTSSAGGPSAHHCTRCQGGLSTRSSCWRLLLAVGLCPPIGFEAHGPKQCRVWYSQRGTHSSTHKILRHVCLEQGMPSAPLPCCCCW